MLGTFKLLREFLRAATDSRVTIAVTIDVALRVQDLVGVDRLDLQLALQLNEVAVQRNVVRLRLYGIHHAGRRSDVLHALHGLASVAPPSFYVLMAQPGRVLNMVALMCVVGLFLARKKRR